MSERALAFVEEWVSDHVRAEDKSGDEQARASTPADRCRADAAAQGISASEIGEAIDDLTAFGVCLAFRSLLDRADHEGVENAEEDALEDKEDEQH